MTDSALSYDLSTFRRLLLAAFTAEDLRRFCEDRPAFRPIVARLSSQHGLDDMVDEVLRYSDTRRLFGELEAAVEEVNPAQYARFEHFLRSGTEAVSIRTLKPGSTLLKGKYRVECHLGRGGFGSVYLACDMLLGDQVAVKELMPMLVGDEGALKRFLVEARTTLKLAHPHLAHTRDVFAEAGSYYMVMEYMPGGSLEDRLKKEKHLPVEEAVRIVAEVCEGLTYAHSRGVVHCDLKPGNILFGTDGAAKVADFGVAHVSTQTVTRSWETSEGFMAGTLPYMSPEQADGVRDDPRIDLYALGAILYRVLTGRTYLEFDERNTPRAQSSNMQRIIAEEPLPPSSYNRRVPAWLDSVVVKALAKRPEDRYAGADQMRAALLAREVRPAAPLPMHPGGPPEARRPRVAVDLPLPEPAAPPVLVGGGRSGTRILWLTGGAGVIVVALIVGLSLALGPWGRGRQGNTPEATVVAVAQQTPSSTRTLAASSTSIPASDTPPPTSTQVPSTKTPVPPTATPAPPTRTPAPPAATLASPTATHSPPTATPRPSTPTPKPATPKAGATRTRAADGMVMVYVPAGQFLMGSTDADNAADNDEKPQHKVTLDAFWIDRTEVTNAHYQKCVDAGACRVADMPSYDPQGKPNHPVVEVTWNDARAYCEWAGARLPTEAEWEKAARGTDGRTYPWGNTFDGTKLNFCDKNCEFDWKDTSADDGYARTAPVGHYPAGASPYGALDMAGNAWEWVADWYGDSYYGSSPARNPQGPGSGEWRVPRGGGWGSKWRDTRAADRYGYVPGLRYHFFGFRCGVATLGG